MIISSFVHKFFVEFIRQALRDYQQLLYTCFKLTCNMQILCVLCGWLSALLLLQVTVLPSLASQIPGYDHRGGQQVDFREETVSSTPDYGVLKKIRNLQGGWVTRDLPQYIPSCKSSGNSRKSFSRESGPAYKLTVCLLQQICALEQLAIREHADPCFVSFGFLGL